MKELFQRTTISIIITSVISFIIGLIMAVVPNVSLQVMGIAFGIFMIIYGVALVVLDFMAHDIYIPFYGIVSGILSVVAGIILVAMPDVIATIFAIALGIWIILSSVNLISIAISVRKGVKNWWMWLILGIIDLICGLIILFNPFASSISLVILGGIIIMVHSVVSIVGMIMVRKDVKDVTKTLKDSYKKMQEAVK